MLVVTSQEGRRGLHLAMLDKTLPLLLLCACASTAELPTADQPELARMAQSYVPQLQAVGITRVVSPGSGAMVRLETGYGSVYVPYPAVPEPSAFVLDIGPDGLQATAATFDRARDGRCSPRSCPKPCGSRPPTTGSGGYAPTPGTETPPAPH